ncbi:GAF and ANTAR domain-containing protein [Pseudokineococcus basanitobsidens]|uniref:GAF and ANTAR domain-containing protein n=1 Tax=Pseudokineococcus basanitobsidens TaxID=1926649 RepID=A0ABU8RMS6_9ACTN
MSHTRGAPLAGAPARHADDGPTSWGGGRVASHRTRQILAGLVDHAVDGHAVDGRSVDGHAVDGRSVDGHAVDGLPHRLVAWCSRSLPVSGTGLVLMSHDQPAGTVAASDGVATGLEELQFTLGEGPCVESSSTGRSVLVPDLALEDGQRWPAFARGALELGARAVFALPLRVGEIRLGVLDLYRDTPGLLVDGDLAEALAFADAATALLLHLQAQAATSATGDQASPVELQDGRAEVHQATGMVSVQSGLPLAASLVVLRSRAYSLGRPVVDVARDVLVGTLDFTRADP